MVPQTGPRSLTIHNQRGLNFYHTNYYAILKENVQVLHKLQPKEFQMSLGKLSAMKFSLVEIWTYFTIWFVMCTYIEMLSIKQKIRKKYKKTKIFYTFNLVVNQMLI